MSDNVLAGPGGIDALRSRVDQIDDQILNLVIERAGLSGAIAAAKANQAGLTDSAGALAMRPGREAEVLRRLINASKGRLDPILVAEVWRNLMTSNLRAQTPFDVWVSPGVDPVVVWDLARRHFSAGAPMQRTTDARSALTRVIENPSSVAVLPFPGNVGSGGWWPILVESKSADLRIVAALPAYSEVGKMPEAAVVARVPLESAGEDETLMITLDEKGRAARVLSEAGLKFEEIERARSQALYRVFDFVAARPNLIRGPGDQGARGSRGAQPRHPGCT